MNLDDAKRIRADHVMGLPVKALDLQLALIVIEESSPRPKGGRRYKLRLPQLSRAERFRVNGIRLYRLGLALGRIEGRKAA